VKTDVLWAIVIVFVLGVIIGYFVAVQVSQTPAQPSTKGILVSENNVLFLPDDAYYGNLTWYLDRANKSVYVVMYVVKFDTSQYNDPVNVILRKLVDLHKRGVDVKVVVDDETKNSYPATINYLVGNGVPVRLDESQGRTTHCKIVVIDDQYVFIGSHNWTESALKYNHEATLLVNSSELASQVVKYIESIWSSGRSIS
jgi:phosphatidylserine/phosphatidylglycerophosphate/cardiolipin synthase-like enzyme